MKFITGVYTQIINAAHLKSNPFQASTINLKEFESTNQNQQLYNNVLEIYLLAENQIKNVAISTYEERELILFKQNYEIFEHFLSDQILILPVLRMRTTTSIRCVQNEMLT